MGRARLMEQQRKRREALKATKKAAAAKATKTANDISRYGSGGKPATTRDASKDASKKPLVLAPKGQKPAAKPSKAPTSSSKVSKPAPKATPTKSNRERAASRFYSSSSGTYGKPLPSNPKLKTQKKTETKNVYNRRGRVVGTKQVEKEEKKKDNRKYNRRGRRVR